MVMENNIQKFSKSIDQNSFFGLSAQETRNEIAVVKSESSQILSFNL